MKILGKHMGTKLQAECKARFVHRFTGEHKPEWAYKPFKNESLQLTSYQFNLLTMPTGCAHLF